MTPRRVGFVDHAVQTGGAQRSLCDLLARLDRDRFEPVLLCTQGAQWTGRPELAGVERVEVWQDTELFGQRRDEVAKSLAGARRHVQGGLKPALDLAGAIRRLGLDLVHTNTLKAHLIGGLAARIARRPLLWHVRDILPAGGALTWLGRARTVLRPRIVAISSAVAAQFGPRAAGITIIHNGVPLDRFAPGAPDPALRAELGLAPTDRAVCVVGRLTPWKGHETLLRAWPQVVAAVPAARLLVVGEVAFWDDDYGQRLQDLAQELGVGGEVRWLGLRDDIAEILRLTELFVLPSVDEPFGRVIIEAMATGCPVVATRSGGVPEVVEEGVTGLLVPPSDAAALGAAMAALLVDPGRATAMGQSGLRRAHRLFDVDRVVQQVQSEYDDVLKAR